MKKLRAAVAFEQYGMWLIAHTDGTVHTEWRAYTSHEVIDLVIYNVTYITHEIAQFLAQHFPRQVVPLAFCFDGPGLQELFKSELMHADLPAGYAWQTLSLGAGVYAAGISYAVRAQYHLLACRLPITVIRMTTALVARAVMVHPIVGTSLQAVRKELFPEGARGCVYAQGL